MVMKKWECTVCGYVHNGDSPPDKCPVCGAGKDKFVELVDENAQPELEPDKPDNIETPDIKNPYDLIVGQILKHHLHPITVHFPNGVIPVSVVFVILAVLFESINLSFAAFANLVFVLLTMPVVVFSGYVEWQKKYGGNMTSYFIIKLICGGGVTLLALILVIWHIANPDVVLTSSQKWWFIFLNLIMLGGAGIAGFIGGKLVFKD